MDRLPLLLLASLVGCVPPPPADRPPPAPTPADDDDDATQPQSSVDEIETVTFAMSLDGLVRPDPNRPDLVSELEGTAHVLYWRDVDAGDIVCRQRFDVSMIGVIGDGLPQLCDGCVGRMRVTAAVPRSGDEEAACGILPRSVDLGFLVDPDDGGFGSDFRQLELIPWRAVEGQRLGREGLAPEDVEARYAALGLQVHYLAAIDPNGWLGEEASLGDVAEPWAEEGLLPMFVLYSDAEDGDGEALEGPLYLTSLWRVGVGDTVGASPAP